MSESSWSIPKLRQTTVIQLGSRSYYIRAREEASLAKDGPTGHRDSAVPAVVVHQDAKNASLQAIQDSFRRFLDMDDVFAEEFTKNGFLLLQKPSMGHLSGDTLKQHPGAANADQAIAEALSADVIDYLKSRSLMLCVLEGDVDVPEGPYFVVHQNLHQAWRIYTDQLGAFSTTVIPDDTHVTTTQGSHTRLFRSLQASAFTGSDAGVAVPSRLYFKRSSEKPLNGMRIAVKDNIHLNGVVTGLGSKAFAELYGHQTESAQFLQLLISKGAVIVGKTKLSAYAGSEIPPCQCIDYFPPWNPRGDGYQGPSGSSSGAAASIAGYDWLDFSICTDTTGSLRFPATSHGVWGLRASWMSIPVEGIVSACELFDTVGLLARTTSKIQDVVTALGTSEDHGDWPTRILYPTDWFPVNDVRQQRMNDAFVKALEDLLGVTHTKISLTEEWTKSCPEDLCEKSLYDLEAMAVVLNRYDGYHNFDEFRSQYRERFHKEPYASPSHTDRWKQGAENTPEERKNAFDMILRFRKWVFEHVFSVGNDGRCRTILVVPHGRPGANYRDVKPEVDSSPLFTISMMGAPQVVVPSTELTLLQVAQDALKKAGWPTNVLTGRFMFEVGDNERHSALEKDVMNGRVG
nr:hypothetical protein L204_06392 [Cryptococcus depauperatus CBS 7855]